MPIPVLAVKSFDSSTSALAGSHAAQHSVMVLPCACAGVVPTPMPTAGASIPHEIRSAFTVRFITLSLLVEPAIDMARLSYPLECFEQSDTVLDGLNELNGRFLAPAGILKDSGKLDCLVNHEILNIASGLFSEGRLDPAACGHPE